MVHTLINALVLIEKFMALFKRPNTIIVSDQVNVAKGALRDGDIMLSTTDWEISNLFIGGKYKHCGVFYKGKVFEATTECVCATDFYEWMYKKDYVGIIRSRQPAVKMEEGIAFMKTCLGEPYNYDFFAINTTKIWFCSEYVYKYLRIAVEGIDRRFFMKKRFGKRTVTPSDFYTDGHNFEVVVEL